MIITDEKLKGSIEDKMAIADSFNLMDDDFFAVVMRDKAACSYTLSRLLDKKLNVIKVDTQYAIRNYNGHSVVLDALAEDEEHKLYNIEVQVKNKDYHPKRVRYYQASLDTLFLEKNQNYKELPELYLIFISATVNTRFAEWSMKRSRKLTTAYTNITLMQQLMTAALLPSCCNI